MQAVADSTVPQRDLLIAAKGGGITFVGNMLEQATRFALGVVVTRSIGAEQFGLYNLGLTVTAIAGGIALLGLPTALTRYVPIYVREGDEPGLWGSLQIAAIGVGGTSLLLGVGIFLFARPLALMVFHKPALTPVLRLASLGLPLVAPIQIGIAVTRGFKHMEYRVYAQNLAGQLTKFATTVLFLSIGMGVMGAVAGHILGGLVAALLLLFYTHRLFSLRRPLASAVYHIRTLLAFSLPIYLSRVIELFRDSIEMLILGILGTTVSVGVFAAAVRISLVGKMFLMAVAMTSMPLISDLYHRGDMRQLARFYQT
ncbi:MAG: hypothetical protein D6759_10920, partial [Chloroflexi bacterium]